MPSIRGLTGGWQDEKQNMCGLEIFKILYKSSYLGLYFFQYWYTIIMALELHYSELSSHKAYNINACFKMHKFCCHFFSCQFLLLLSTNVFNDKQYISLGMLVPNSKD